ncbi:exonuclease [Zalerion maritima]|uniref:Exonuclease n=1 Tax=Zalerion maritima TaxID=339359 RepID=A0AAD5WN55_9PEZI|nr:exonuclease [Zalerion maritima]
MTMTLKDLEFSTPAYPCASGNDLANGTNCTEMNKEKTTLRTILEGPSVAKTFLDVRNDSGALFSLFSLYNRSLARSQDIQLLENALRPAWGRKCVKGLEKCIQDDSPLFKSKRDEWAKAKQGGKAKINSRHEIFSDRPMTSEIQEYYLGDVTMLPKLRETYWERLSEGWKEKVLEESGKRDEESHRGGCEPHGDHKLLGPWGYKARPRSDYDFDDDYWN